MATPVHNEKLINLKDTVRPNKEKLSYLQDSYTTGICGHPNMCLN